MYIKFPENNVQVASEVVSWKHLIYVLVIWYNYKKLKIIKFLWFIIFFYFKCAISLNENCRIRFRKMKMCPLDIVFLHKVLYRIAIKCRESLFLQKNLTREMMEIPYSPPILVKGMKNCLLRKKKSTLTFINKQNLIISKI